MKVVFNNKNKKKIVRKWRLYGWGIVGSRCPAAVVVFHSRREGKVCVQTTGFYYWNLEKKNKRGLPSSVYTAAKCKAVLASNARCCWLGAEVKSRSAMSCSLFQPTRTIASMAFFFLSSTFKAYSAVYHMASNPGVRRHRRQHSIVFPTTKKKEIEPLFFFLSLCCFVIKYYPVS